MLQSTDLSALTKAITTTIQQLKGREPQGKVLLVIDQLDLLLAAGGEAIKPGDLGDLLLTLREVNTSDVAW